MPSLATLDSALVVPGSEAALGSTPFANTKQPSDSLCLQGHPQKRQILFHTLPAELHINIMAHLHHDPVSMICFGLTSRHFYQIFHEVVDEGKRYEGTKRYPIKNHPFDLRMQASVCGNWVWRGWHEWYFLYGDTQIVWERSLGELLAGEKWLWGNLRSCEECLRYKPEEAYGEFEYEGMVAKRWASEWMALEKDDPQWGKVNCRRCRAKVLLVFWEGRMEVRDKGSPFVEDNESKGLVREGKEGRFWEEQWKMMAGYEAIGDIFEPWEEVFMKLDI